MFQAKRVSESFATSPDRLIHNQNVNIPPAEHLVGDLEPHSPYAVRVACHSSQGPSDWSPWVEIRTREGGESPEGVSVPVAPHTRVTHSVKAVLSGCWSPPVPARHPRWWEEGWCRGKEGDGRCVGFSMPAHAASIPE